MLSLHPHHAQHRENVAVENLGLRTLRGEHDIFRRQGMELVFLTKLIHRVRVKSGDIHPALPRPNRTFGDVKFIHLALMPFDFCFAVVTPLNPHCFRFRGLIHPLHIFDSG